MSDDASDNAVAAIAEEEVAFTPHDDRCIGCGKFFKTLVLCDECKRVAQERMRIATERRRERH